MLREFNVLKRLGEGSFGSVYLVRRISDGKQYALKKVKLLGLPQKDKQNALNEIRLIASVTHQNVVQYKESFIDVASNSLCLVMEFAEGGDVLKKIETNFKKGQCFAEYELWSALIQLCAGLKALHDLKIMHRDIKCANVLIGVGGAVKLADFNVSKVISGKNAMLYTQTGTPYYASPEVWKDKPYDFKSDMWSLGVVLYEMAALRPPFKAKDMGGLYAKITQAQYPPLSNRYSREFREVIGIILQPNPQNRPSVTQLLNSRLVQQKIAEFRQFDQNVSKAMESIDLANISNFKSSKYLTISNGPNNEDCGSANSNGTNELLQTIKLPRVLKKLTDMLPKANYEKSPSIQELLPLAKQQENEQSPSTGKSGSTQETTPSSNVTDKSSPSQSPVSDHRHSKNNQNAILSSNLNLAASLKKETSQPTQKSNVHIYQTPSQSSNQKQNVISNKLNETQTRVLASDGATQPSTGEQNQKQRSSAKKVKSETPKLTSAKSSALEMIPDPKEKRKIKNSRIGGFIFDPIIEDEGLRPANDSKATSQMRNQSALQVTKGEKEEESIPKLVLNNKENRVSSLGPLLSQQGNSARALIIPPPSEKSSKIGLIQHNQPRNSSCKVVGSHPANHLAFESRRAAQNNQNLGQQNNSNLSSVGQSKMSNNQADQHYLPSLISLNPPMAPMQFLTANKANANVIASSSFVQQGNSKLQQMVANQFGLHGNNNSFGFGNVPSTDVCQENEMISEQISSLINLQQADAHRHVFDPLSNDRQSEISERQKFITSTKSKIVARNLHNSQNNAILNSKQAQDNSDKENASNAPGIRQQFMNYRQERQNFQAGNNYADFRPSQMPLQQQQNPQNVINKVSSHVRKLSQNVAGENKKPYVISKQSKNPMHQQQITRQNPCSMIRRGQYVNQSCDALYAATADEIIYLSDDSEEIAEMNYNDQKMQQNQRRKDGSFKKPFASDYESKEDQVQRNNGGVVAHYQSRNRQNVVDSFKANLNSQSASQLPEFNNDNSAIKVAITQKVSPMRKRISPTNSVNPVRKESSPANQQLLHHQVYGVQNVSKSSNKIQKTNTLAKVSPRMNQNVSLEDLGYQNSPNTNQILKPNNTALESSSAKKRKKQNRNMRYSMIKKSSLAEISDHQKQSLQSLDCQVDCDVRKVQQIVSSVQKRIQNIDYQQLQGVGPIPAQALSARRSNQPISYGSPIGPKGTVSIDQQKRDGNFKREVLKDVSNSMELISEKNRMAGKKPTGGCHVAGGLSKPSCGNFVNSGSKENCTNAWAKQQFGVSALPKQPFMMKQSQEQFVGVGLLSGVAQQYPLQQSEREISGGESSCAASPYTNFKGKMSSSAVIIREENEDIGDGRTSFGTKNTPNQLFHDSYHQEMIPENKAVRQLRQARQIRESHQQAMWAANSATAHQQNQQIQSSNFQQFSSSASKNNCGFSNHSRQHSAERIQMFSMGVGAIGPNSIKNQPMRPFQMIDSFDGEIGQSSQDSMMGGLSQIQHQNISLSNSPSKRRRNYVKKNDNNGVDLGIGSIPSVNLNDLRSNQRNHQMIGISIEQIDDETF